jgi:hypothetical protein
VGVFIPIAAIGAWAWVRTAKLKAGPRGLDPETAGRLDTLEHEIGTLRHELGETQERLDFAERLLAQRKPDELNPPTSQR